MQKLWWKPVCHLTSLSSLLCLHFIALSAVTDTPPRSHRDTTHHTHWDTWACEWETVWECVGVCYVYCMKLGYDIVLWARPHLYCIHLSLPPPAHTRLTTHDSKHDLETTRACTSVCSSDPARLNHEPLLLIITWAFLHVCMNTAESVWFMTRSAALNTV